MGGMCGTVICCGLWVHRSNSGCYGIFDQSSGVALKTLNPEPTRVGLGVLDSMLGPTFSPDA